MPVCPEPTKECEAIEGSGRVGFYILESGIYYRTQRRDWADGGFEQTQAVSDHFAELGGVDIVPPAPPFHDFTEGFPKTGASTDSLLDPVDVNASRASAYLALTGAALDWDTMDLTSTDPCNAGTQNYDPPISPSGTHLYVRFSRFRWVIPSEHPGSYFKITWDVLFFPNEYDPEDPESPQPEIVAANQTWEWTGPGDPEEPETWKSPWIDLVPTAESGVVKVVNVRYECYTSSKFGNRPQTLGEFYDLPVEP